MIQLVQSRSAQALSCSLTLLAVLLAPVHEAKAETTWERIQRTKTVRVGTDGAPPLATVSAQGELGGQSPLVLIRALEPLGVENFEAVQMDFSSLIPALQAGQIDVIASSMAIRPARCSQVSFGEPDFRIAMGLAVPEGNPNELHSLEDIAADSSLTLGVLQAGVEIEYARAAGISASQIVMFPDMSASVLGLSGGRVAALANGRTYLNALPVFRNSAVEFADPFELPVNADGTPSYYYTAVAFRTQDGDFLDAYNESFEALRAAGGLLEIIEEAEAGGQMELPEEGVTTASLCSQG